MNKKELVEKMAKGMGLTKTQAELTMEEVFNIIKECLISEKIISIPRFGKFEVITVPGHIGRNPATGEEIDIPEKNKVKFKPSTILKAEIN
jgi:DNA-binding protein HU-beta